MRFMQFSPVLVFFFPMSLLKEGKFSGNGGVFLRAVVAALHAPTHRSDGLSGWGICTRFSDTHGNYSYTKTVSVAP